jgi:site-specific recombinase XerD
MLLEEARPGFVGWLRATKGLSPHTVRAYEGDVATLRRHVGTAVTVDEISPEVILAFLLKLRERGLSEASLKRRFAGIRCFTQWLLLTTAVAADPCRDVATRLARPRRLPRAVPPRDLQRLFDYLLRTAGVTGRSAPVHTTRPHELTTLLGTALMVVTGVRVSELTSIRLIDMDLSAGHVRIVGKGRRERTVYLPGGWLASLCGLYLRTRKQVDPLTPPAVRLRLAKASENAELYQKVTPHMLRHSAATQLLESGLDIRYVQRLLGHASITTTENYTHVSDRALRQMVAKANVLDSMVRAI